MTEIADRRKVPLYRLLLKYHSSVADLCRAKQPIRVLVYGDLMVVLFRSKLYQRRKCIGFGDRMEWTPPLCLTCRLIPKTRAEATSSCWEYSIGGRRRG